jgi:hypothetical protein
MKLKNPPPDIGDERERLGELCAASIAHLALRGQPTAASNLEFSSPLHKMSTLCTNFITSEINFSARASV